MPELPQCKMQVKPWSTSQAFCSLLELNCFASGFSGTRTEVTTPWSEFDPTTVTRVVVRHCPAASKYDGGELPLGLQADDFPQSLEDIEFCVTNLISLPDDLDMKWPQYASIYLEASQF
ncbi:hypothetical protein GQ600_14481 [Phytophthora cactorum]|nr:hypothetical protein GQ600_14481 [Phytophthora cactorum]